MVEVAVKGARRGLQTLNGSLRTCTFASAQGTEMADSYSLGTKRPDYYSYISTNINETSGSCIIKQVIVGVDAYVCSIHTA